MKPLKLILEGLTAFRRRSEIDFRSLRLFAITGPTGSGKSSLLDAITLALYGEVERVGRRIDDLISHGASRLVVQLEFEVSGRAFRVARSRRRGGGGEAILEELSGGKPRFLASGVRAVDHQIGELIGLSYDAFVQAAILPQGAFARFLRSEPKRRREILRQLLRLQRYKRMQELASLKRRALEQRCRDLEMRLAEDYAEATEARLKALEEALDRALQEEKALEARLASEREAFRTLEERYRKTQQWLALKSALGALTARLDEIEDKRERLRKAERAQSLWPLLELARDAERRKREAERAFEEVEERYRAAQKARQQAEERLQRLENGAELERLREKWQKLGEIEGWLEMVHAFRQKRQDLLADLQRCQEEGKRRQTDERRSRLAREIAELEQALSELEVDLSLLRRLESHLETAHTLKQKEKRLSEIETEILTARAACSEAEAALREAEARLLDIQRRLERRRLEHTASWLRRQLQAGERCPVCRQKVRQLPLELSGTDERFSELERQEKEAKEAWETARQERDRWRGQLALRFQEHARLKNEIEALTEPLRVTFPDLVPPLAEAVIEGHQRLLQRQREREALARELEAKRAEYHRLEMEAQRGRALLAERDRLTSELHELDQRLETIERKIRAVTDHPSPLAERQALKRKLDQLERELSQARGAFEEASQRLSQLEAMLKLRKAQLERERQEAEKRLGVAAEALSAHGFRTMAEVEAAYLPPNEIERLREDIESYQRKERHLREQISTLQQEIGPQPPTEEDYQKAQAKLEAMERDFRALSERRAVLEREVSHLRGRLKQAKALRAELAQTLQEFHRYRQLAEDLRDDRFQEFLLKELFGELVAGASDRLFEMTGRYRLEYEEGSFSVIDEEHGAERRRAETLSGGETFLASLALALELSEQVCRHAGGVVLESLFIDEGFGTLDPEALDKVATTLEGLLETGRMVGVITHLTELAERLPARIVVERRLSGSMLRVVQ